MTRATYCDFCGKIKPKFQGLVWDTIHFDYWKTVHSLGSTEDLCPACYDLLKKIAKDGGSASDRTVKIIDKDW